MLLFNNLQICQRNFNFELRGTSNIKSIMTEGSSKDIKWMYDGPKSLVNREDYLLGKKIDKNFELFSDVVVKQKDEDNTELFERKTLSTAPSKVTVLDLGIVRNEDPLVAIRVREEQRKRALLENPLLKLRAQKLLKKEYEKEMRKMEKKRLKKEKKKSRSTSSSSSDSAPKSKKRSRKHDSRDRDRDERRHREDKDRKDKNEREHHKHHERKREGHTGDRASNAHSSHESRKTRAEDRNKPSSFSNQPSQARKRLTAEELEAKRQAMLANAKWRDDVRDETIQIATEKLRKEEEEQAKSKNLPLKPLLGTITNASTSVEGRIKSKKQNLQRSHDYMERSFTRK